MTTQHKPRFDSPIIYYVDIDYPGRSYDVERYEFADQSEAEDCYYSVVQDITDCGYSTVYTVVLGWHVTSCKVGGVFASTFV